MSVYFARQGITGNVKIGFTTDIVKRIKSLQTGQPHHIWLMRLFDGDQQDEKAAHRRFAHLAIGREWFRFHPDMMGDVGLQEMPAPEIGRYHKHNWPCSAGDYERELHKEALAAIGGPDELARRCSVPPWSVTNGGNGYFISPSWFGAVAIVLAERGRMDITHQMLMEAREATLEVKRKDDEQRAHKEVVEREAGWLKRHPGVPPWWEVLPENRHLIEEPKLEAVPDSTPGPAELAEAS